MLPCSLEQCDDAFYLPGSNDDLVVCDRRMFISVGVKQKYANTRKRKVQ
jgi:hypothetical protein